MSTDGQRDEGWSLPDQQTRLRDAAQQRGWTVVGEVAEAASAATVDGRPGLVGLLERLDAGEADLLVATRLDRLSRDVVDVEVLGRRARTGGWALVVLDGGGNLTADPDDVDAWTARALSSVLNHRERLVIAARTRQGMAAARQRGVHVGGPVTLDEATRARVWREHQEGLSLRAIARGLTDDGVETARGGRWHASTVRGVVRSVEAEREREAAAARWRAEQAAKTAAPA